jgi:uncharacterized membrane protein
LADNGGPTLSHLPHGFSPVIDAIPAISCTLATDQRGEARPANGGCDIGAVEFDYGAPGVELELDSLIRAAPGEVVTHTFVLTNTGDEIDSFTLALSGYTWPTTLSDATSSPLNPGSTYTVTAIVNIPANPRAATAIIGSDTFTLTVVSRTDGSSTTAIGTTQATAATGVVLSGDQSSSGRSGETATYTVPVSNSGAFTDTIGLTSRGNAWPVELSSTDITLGAGKAGTVVITVTIPSTVALGSSDRVTITATSTLDALSSDSAILTTTMEVLNVHLPLLLKD